MSLSKGDKGRFDKEGEDPLVGVKGWMQGRSQEPKNIGWKPLEEARKWTLP